MFGGICHLPATPVLAEAFIRNRAGGAPKCFAANRLFFAEARLFSAK
jgi:hypothetical protein